MREVYVMFCGRQQCGGAVADKRPGV